MHNSDPVREELAKSAYAVDDVLLISKPANKLRHLSTDVLQGRAELMECDGVLMSRAGRARTRAAQEEPQRYTKAYAVTAMATTYQQIGSEAISSAYA